MHYMLLFIIVHHSPTITHHIIRFCIFVVIQILLFLPILFNSINKQTANVQRLDAIIKILLVVHTSEYQETIICDHIFLLESLLMKGYESSTSACVEENFTICKKSYRNCQKQRIGRPYQDNYINLCISQCNFT